ncbi:hypothetical protein MRX96_018700 [Rhipicephalus microplus]
MNPQKDWARHKVRAVALAKQYKSDANAAFVYVAKHSLRRCVYAMADTRASTGQLIEVGTIKAKTPCQAEEVAIGLPMGVQGIRMILSDSKTVNMNPEKDWARHKVRAVDLAKQYKSDVNAAFVYVAEHSLRRCVYAMAVIRASTGELIEVAQVFPAAGVAPGTPNSELSSTPLDLERLFFLAQDHRPAATCLLKSSSSFSNTSKASSAIQESVMSKGNVGRLGLTGPTPQYGSLRK